MKRNKVVDLLSFMTNKEKAELALFLKRSSNKRHFQLYEVIQNLSHESFDLAMIFQKIYKKPYSPSKDYLIRNDFRHLGQRITQFIVLLHSTESNQHDYTLLKWLLEKKGYHLFEIEWKRSRKKALKTRHYKDLLHLNDLKIRFLRESQPLSKKLFQDIAQICDENENFLQQRNAERKLENELNRVFAKRSLKAYEPQTKLDTQQLPKDLHQLIKENYYLHYLYLKVQSYILADEQKIQVLGEILSVLPALKNRINTDEEATIVKASIALEYFLSNKYEKALKTYESILTDLHYLKQQQQLAVLFNYTTTLLRNQKYEKVAQLIAHQEKTIRKSNLADRFYCIQSMCYLFLDQTDKAYHSLPDNFLQYSRHDHIYLRCILSIIFYKQGELSLAQNEIHNLVQTQVYKKDSVAIMQEMIRLFQQFYRLKSLPIKSEKRIQAEEELQTRLHQLNADQNPVENSQLLPMIWLGREINS